MSESTLSQSTQFAAGRTSEPSATSSCALPMTQRLMPLQEVADACGVGTSTIYRWAAGGIDGFPLQVQFGTTRKNGRSAKAFWDRAEIEAWIEKQLAKPRRVPQTVVIAVCQPA